MRPYDWQFAASVQQQLLPRVSAEFGYSRRSWGNFTYTDNRAVTAADFDTFTMTVPTRFATAEQRRADLVPAAEAVGVRAGRTTTSRAPTDYGDVTRPTGRASS